MFRRSLLVCLLSASLAIALLQTGLCEGELLVFRHHGKEVSRFSRQQLEALSPAKTVRIYEPHVDADRTYKAIPLQPVLRSVYGGDWKEAGGDLLFIGSDGYQSSVTLEQFERAPTLLAFAMADGGEFGFTHIRPPHKSVTLAPYYLVWDFNETPELRSDEDYSWPYKVVAIELIDFEDRYPNLTPPSNSSEAVMRGFKAYRTYCMTCHQIQGQGGTSGPELNTPQTDLSKWEEEELRRYLINPQSVRPNSQMPGLLQSLPDLEGTAQDIILYLKALEETAKPGR